MGASIAKASVVILALCALSGCAAKVDEKRLMLAPSPSVSAASVPAGLIALRQASLPDYARDPRIFLEGADGSLTVEEGQRWADAPDRFVTRRLAATLDAAVSADVVAEPWPRAARPDLVVEVYFDRLLGDATGSVRADGRFRLYRPEAEGVAFHDFRLSARGGGPVGGQAGYRAISEGYARVLADLAGEIGAKAAEIPRARRRRR